MIGSDVPGKISNLTFLRSSKNVLSSVSNCVGYFNQWFDKIATKGAKEIKKKTENNLNTCKTTAPKLIYTNINILRSNKPI